MIIKIPIIGEVMRILALDVGDKRIGVAVSDPTQTIATKLKTIYREKTDAINEIQTICKENDVGEIVVGIPLRIDGTKGAQFEKTSLFIEKLKEKIDIPVVEWDERFTTVQANRALSEGNATGRKKKLVVDGIAAALVLQNYLDNSKRKMG